MIILAALPALMLSAPTLTAPPAAPQLAMADTAAGDAAAPPPPKPAEGDTITVTASGIHPTRADPMAKLNAKSFEAVQAVDHAVVAPLAYAYRDALPRPLRRGLHNVLTNLEEPVIALNFMLQHKPGRSFRHVGRFAINSTVGIGGVLDVAASRAIGIRYEHNGFADTMGFYGVGPGPYFYLPIIGPTTVRDMLGLWMDRLTIPLVATVKPLKTPYYIIGATVVRSLDYRVEYDQTFRELHKDPAKAYVTERIWYLKLRRDEIDALKRGRPVPEMNPAPVPPAKVSQAAAVAYPAVDQPL